MADIRQWTAITRGLNDMLLGFGNGNPIGPGAVLAVLLAGFAMSFPAVAQDAGASDNTRTWNVVCRSAGREARPASGWRA